MENFLVIYVILALLNIPIIMKTTANVYKAKNRELDFMAVVLILILSVVFPLSWLAALIFVLFSEN